MNIKKRCLLNNMNMDVQRKSPVYQTLLVDLVNVGAVDKSIAEALLGYEIPAMLKLPSWYKEPADDQARDE